MKISRLITASFLGFTLVFSPLASFARDHNNGNGRRPGAQQHQQGGQRPQPQRPQNQQRPQPNGNHQGRPGNSGNDNRWNYGNGNHGARPQPSMPSQNMRPSAPAPRPQPSARPLPATRPAPMPPRPTRPHIPAYTYNHWHNRPVPPAHFRPAYRISPLQSILGITLGTALNISINALRSNNYAISGYDNNCLYLNNINAFGYIWPDAILYYGGGYLSQSVFSFATSYYDTARYNNMYRTLTAQYGAPVSTNYGQGSLSATWWGYDNRYITLDLTNTLCADGVYRYVTSVRVG